MTTPEQALQTAIHDVSLAQNDHEHAHLLLDNLMESILIEQGYEELVTYIRNQTRWYA